MSRIRTWLENQVFYRKLTKPEWNLIRGNFSNVRLSEIMNDSAASKELKLWLKLITLNNIHAKWKKSIAIKLGHIRTDAMNGSFLNVETLAPTPDAVPGDALHDDAMRSARLSRGVCALPPITVIQPLKKPASFVAGSEVVVT